ncbi:MAG TPA: thioredoxin family protein [Burkholderiales bacterium]|nr:thioredoxin family protein [Burkholderiales bacterium]
MAQIQIPVHPFGWQAADFDLKGVDGKRHTLASARGPNGLVVMFICNHCPYVKAVIDRIVRDCGELKAQGIGSIAIMSNDPADYPEDSFDNMVRVAKAKHFPFPYVLDETQDVAKTYLAQCTPDFFGFDAKLALRYRGRLDASGRQAVPNARRELYEAMVGVAKTGLGPQDQTPSIGCSIKWRS